MDVCYLDCGDGLANVYVYQNLLNFTLKCVVYCLFLFLFLKESNRERGEQEHTIADKGPPSSLMFLNARLEYTDAKKIKQNKIAALTHTKSLHVSFTISLSSVPFHFY